MLKFGIKNLRRLSEIEPVEIKPINILVGKNSSGKSTFLRSLPLLRQSIATRTSAPLLWYGDLVDFGSFEGSVSENDLEKEISFLFEAEDLNVHPFGRRPYYYSESWNFESASVSYAISSSSANERTWVSSIRLRVPELDAEYIVGVDKTGNVVSFDLNGEEVLDAFGGATLKVSPGEVFPEIFSIEKIQSASGEIRASVAPTRALISNLHSQIRGHLDARMRDDSVREVIAELFGPKVLNRDALNVLSRRTDRRTWEKLLHKMAGSPEWNLSRQVYKATSIAKALSILEAMSSFLHTLMNSVLYIGPARARSERYYRYQDLAVSEIDPDGKNFSMFINSLTRNQISNLSSWVESLFGFGISLSRTSGHISINQVVGEKATNVVDTGYGVSQILPVLGQIWWATQPQRRGRLSQESRLRRRSWNPDQTATILAIEQPELHLHPAHQALLADAFVRAVRPSGDSGDDSQQQKIDEGGLRFVVETHSEALINRLGELVERKVVDPNNIQVLIFEPDESKGVTDVQVARFGKNGQLINWPYGFFLPD